ncbi:hypothetical protein GUG52_16080, partial [Xanthomonas citri pv. citri]|nr:hypothetical protein [Xanthomonas citri pv. citri]
VCFSLVCVIVFSIVVTGMTVYIMKASDSDSTINLDAESIKHSGITTIYGTDDGGGEVALASLSTGTKRIWVDINDVPAVVKNAIV